MSYSSRKCIQFTAVKYSQNHLWLKTIYLYPFLSNSCITHSLSISLLQIQVPKKKIIGSVLSYIGLKQI